MLSARRAASQTVELELLEAEPQRRPELQGFIAERFAEVYGAELYNFMPRLFGLQDDSGELLAAFGMRAAERDGKRELLFLEHYLDRPVEALVAQVAGRPVPRCHIVEVGNLAGASPGALRQLIPLLCERLHQDGFHWVVFTGPARLCNSFSRLGLPLQVLAPAPVEKLSAEERRHWGRYYDHRPSVMAGDIGPAARLLRELRRTPGGLQQLLAPLAGVGAP
ncbi:thermostable hemolysin [Hydrocarboniphaga sp.]|uniref:thermostable hemolysin n=1 Tax=Hydrocarboniphaga sp. TaxID=2033016 RepID=UPI003D101175